MRELGPVFTAEVVGAFGADLTATLVRHFGYELTGLRRWNEPDAQVLKALVVPPYAKLRKHAVIAGVVLVLWSSARIFTALANSQLSWSRTLDPI